MTAIETGIEALRRQQRLIFRCVMAFALAGARRDTRRFAGDFVLGIVFKAIVQATRPLPNRPPRTISVRAVAQSLELPYETTRRKVGELVATGFCSRLDGGALAASAEVLAGPEQRAFDLATWNGVARLFAELRHVGFPAVGPAGDPSDPAPTDAQLTALVDLSAALELRILECGAAPHGSMQDALIVTALIMANAEPVTNDPELAWKYAGAETPPPDSLRRPVTGADLADRLGIPYEKVRRRLKDYVRLGWVSRVPGGFLYSMTRMQEPEVIQTGLDSAQRFLQFVQAVRQLGVNPMPIEA